MYSQLSYSIRINEQVWIQNVWKFYRLTHYNGLYNKFRITSEPVDDINDAHFCQLSNRNQDFDISMKSVRAVDCVKRI